MSPRELLRTPLWALRVLVEELPGVEAERVAHMAQAATMPHLKDGERRAQWHELRALTRPRGMVYVSPPEPSDAPPPTHDPAAAAAYFAGLGARVRKVDAS